ncbi:hypothetical protein M432DRAFT_373882 [Thermoascus aurantiacus ATCC 26904]
MRRREDKVKDHYLNIQLHRGPVKRCDMAAEMLLSRRASRVRFLFLPLQPPPADSLHKPPRVSGQEETMPMKQGQRTCSYIVFPSPFSGRLGERSRWLAWFDSVRFPSPVSITSMLTGTGRCRSSNRIRDALEEDYSELPWPLDHPRCCPAIVSGRLDGLPRQPAWHETPRPVSRAPDLARGGIAVRPGTSIRRRVLRSVGSIHRCTLRDTVWRRREQQVRGRTRDVRNGRHQGSSGTRDALRPAADITPPFEKSHDTWPRELLIARPAWTPARRVAGNAGGAAAREGRRWRCWDEQQALPSVRTNDGSTG